MKRWKTAVRITAFLLCAALLLEGLTIVLKDKHVTFDYDTTRKIEGFYAEKRNSLDFVFIGSSQMFTSVVPAVLWEEYGITSYDFGANEQPLDYSYYYMKEALKYQNPKAVVIEISYCRDREETREGVSHINLDDLRMGRNRIEAIYDRILAGERFAYLFPLAKYHDTWTNLDQASLSYLTTDKHNPYKGYTPSLEGLADGGVFDEEILEITDCEPLPEVPAEYLQKIIDYSREKNVELIFLKTPNGSDSGQKYYNTVEALAAENGIPFLNMNKIMPGQMHNHVYHAERISSYLGKYLSERYEIEDKRGQEAYARWESDAQYFYRYRQMLELQSPATFEEYMEYLRGKGYLVCMAVNDDIGTFLSKDQEALLQSFGITEDLTGAEGESYLAVFDDEKLYAELRGDIPLVYKEVLDGKTFTVISQGNHAGKYAEITIDGEDYAKNEKGFNIVVYDPILKQVADSRNFVIVD